MLRRDRRVQIGLEEQVQVVLVQAGQGWEWARAPACL